MNSLQCSYDTGQYITIATGLLYRSPSITTHCRCWGSLCAMCVVLSGSDLPGVGGWTPSSPIDPLSSFAWLTYGGSLTPQLLAAVWGSTLWRSWSGMPVQTICLQAAEIVGLLDFSMHKYFSRFCPCNRLPASEVSVKWSSSHSGQKSSCSYYIEGFGDD